jgi:hypothetical protein
MRLGSWAVLATVSPTSLAMQCGTNLISEGDTTLRLLTFCGEPAQVEQREDRIPLTLYDEASETYVLEHEVRHYEVWTYNFGPLRPMQRLTIRYGKVYRIESGGLGF